MSLPNMKTFCLSTVKPYIQSVADNFDKRLENITGNEELLNDVAEQSKQQEEAIASLSTATSTNTTDIDSIKVFVENATVKLEHIPESRLRQICQDAWTEA